MIFVNLNQDDKIFSKRKFSLIFIMLLMSSVFVAKDALIVSAQTVDKSEKEINLLSFGNEPIEITDLETNQSKINIGEKFKRDENWLQGFTVEYRNKTDKEIVYIELGLDFPETDKITGNVMSFPLIYGIRLSAINKKSILGEKNNSIKSIAPNETVKLILTDEKYQQLKRFIETRQPLDSLTEVDIRITFIRFADGTGWSGGSMMRPDPKNPKNYVPFDSIIRK